MDVREWCKAKGIRSEAEQVDRNPHMEDSADMDHWRVILWRGKRRLTVVFSMGYAHGGREPEAAEVLDCLASDASGVESARDFSDWCAEYGYSDDSRKAERIYTTCKRHARNLRRFLGDGPYDDLLWDTERL